MFILYWIFFVLLLYIYGKILLPIFENILSVIFQPNLAEGMSFFLIFSLSVLTLAKFLNGDFHIQNLLSEDSIGEIISLMKTGEISKEDALTYLNPNDPKIKSLLKSKYKHYGL